jgi:beta-lactam-binding protein with PASTA domain/tRNA A-37 threonylcarbamoyl transferase component Bud32
MDTTLARPPVGQLLDGRYRIESLIARGGMATVYLGTDTRLDRTVALKIMHPELANDEDFVRRFVGEARSVARLSHPNVVAVYDQGADGRTLYLAMEYVPGQTLRDLLNERGRLGPRAALTVMDGVLAGLAAAHEAGLAHRDVKPENVLLTDAHSVKVADFGLARLLAGASHTKTGMIIGTAAYLAPEQVAGGTADARTDVYAAGIMLFELLTGAQPHTGESPLAVAYQHVNAVVPAPSSLVPGLPPALDTLVALATSRDPDLRPVDAGQFLWAVNEVRQGMPGASPAGAPEGAAAVRAGVADRLLASPPVPPPSWPAEVTPADRYTGDPLRSAERPPYGVPVDTFGASAMTRQMPDARGPGNHTLVVANTGAAAPFATGPYDGGQARYPGPREPGLQRWLFSRKLGYLTAGVLAVVFAVVAVWWLAAGRYTKVPEVGGLMASTAGAELRNGGLNVKGDTAVFSNQVAKGDVVGTIPAMGSRVAKGAAVTLIVSSGPHMIAVPQVTGGTLAAAQTGLRQAGLTAGTVSNEPSATIQAGVVISTNPAAGTSWPQSKPVGIVVSAGPPVPNFVGQQKPVAEQWAQQNGVSLNEVADTKSNQPQGTVTQQSVPPGGAFTRGQVITISISAGPQMVGVPNVNGMSVADATQALKQLGFQVNVNQVGPLQTVFNYSPNGQAPQGSTITIWAGF